MHASLVGATVGPVGEGATAPGTSVRPLARVQIVVILQVLGAAEALATGDALVGLGVSVHHQVHAEGAAGVELHGAVGAAVWGLAVRVQVQLETVLGLEPEGGTDAPCTQP